MEFPTTDVPALLATLVRYDTSNPPGKEAACIGYIEGLLREAGLETCVIASDPARPNLVARVPGAGGRAPLLLQGHVDVVPADEGWTHPPFAGTKDQGCIWGRGALDMKGGVAMMISAVLQLRRSGEAPPGDIILCLLSDEEAGSALGAKYLVEHHAHLFDGVRHGIGEFGAFSVPMAGVNLYPIQVSERARCHLRLTFRGAPGHASLPVHDGAVAKLGRFLAALDDHAFAVRVTPPLRLMVESMAGFLPEPAASALRASLDPARTRSALAALGPAADRLAPLYANTASPTVVAGSTSRNVIPSTASVVLDGRLVPGAKPEDFIGELRALLGPDTAVELLEHDPVPPGRPDLTQFETLAAILREMEPSAVPIPFMLTGSSDARFFARLGIQTYGFTPLRLPPGFDFLGTIHAADERVPIDALRFGTEAIRQALVRCL